MNTSIIITLIALIIFFLTFGLKFMSLWSFFIILVFAVFLFFFGETVGIKAIEALHQGNIKYFLLLFIGGLIIVSLVWSGIWAYENKNKINQNWPTYKCKPYVLPFAGWAIGPGSTNPTDNFMDCLWTLNKSFFDILISPFVKIIELILQILKGFGEDIQNSRKMIAYIRSSMEDIAKDVYQKLWDAYSRIAFLFKTIIKVFKKLFDVFEDVFEVLYYSICTLGSIWNGPLGGVISFFCFDPETSVMMSNGSYSYLRNLKVGSYLHPNNQILSKMTFSSKDVPMYQYHNIIVAGSHLVNENGKWIRVKDSANATLIPYEKDEIICLETDDSFINIDGIEFRDYFETKNPEITQIIYQTILKYLNTKEIIPFNKININENQKIYNWGFDINTPINMIDKTKKLIKNIKIGDETRYGKVIGIVKILNNNLRIYQYQGITLSGTVLVNENNNWLPIALSKLSKPFSQYQEPYLYNLVTDTNILIADNNIFTDFEQTNNPQVNQKIDEYIEFFINHC